MLVTINLRSHRISAAFQQLVTNLKGIFSLLASYLFGGVVVLVVVGKIAVAKREIAFYTKKMSLALSACFLCHRLLVL